MAAKRKTKRRAPAAPATLKTVRQAAVWLSCVFPTVVPVRVRWATRMRDPDQIGELIPRQDHFEIRLKAHLSAFTAIDTLRHEWAHALTVPGLMMGEDPHSTRFYDVLGQIERAWLRGGHTAAARLAL